MRNCLYWSMHSSKLPHFIDRKCNFTSQNMEFAAPAMFNLDLSMKSVDFRENDKNCFLSIVPHTTLCPITQTIHLTIFYLSMIAMITDDTLRPTLWAPIITSTHMCWSSTPSVLMKGRKFLSTAVQVNISLLHSLRCELIVWWRAFYLPLASQVWFYPPFL